MSVESPSAGVILRVITGDVLQLREFFKRTLLTSARLFQHRLRGHRWPEIDGSAVHLAYDDREFAVDWKYSLDVEFVQLAIDMILVLAHEETF
jgi:hypothetical protein